MSWNYQYIRTGTSGSSYISLPNASQFSEITFFVFGYFDEATAQAESEG